MKGLNVRSVKDRLYYVTREDAFKVLEACPDAQRRLVFALARFGGLRIPSELAIKLVDIDWEHDRITVHSPKTEHHEGGESRQIPIFPELRPYLEEVWEAAPEGEEFLLEPRYRAKEVNLGTQMNRIIQRAGLKPWPKTFQNCRSTRETELAQEWPIHLVCKWIGNTLDVAREHYLQVRDEDFAKASRYSTKYSAKYDAAAIGRLGHIQARNDASP